MTPEERSRRKERAQAETLIISRTDEGFRVYSPQRSSTTYLVTGIPDTPECTCADFRVHEGDPDWHCKHILAVLDRFAGGTDEGKGAAPAEPGGPDREPAPHPAAAETPREQNGPTQMVLKRSVSPDHRIDSFSVELSIPVDGTTLRAIKARAQKSVKLQTEIVTQFLADTAKHGGNGNRAESGNGTLAARMLSVGGMDGQYGRRLFIAFQADGKTLRLFGSRKQLAEQVRGAGYPDLADEIDEGIELDVPCRITTKPSRDGKYLNVERVLPTDESRPRERAAR